MVAPDLPPNPENVDNQSLKTVEPTEVSIEPNKNLGQQNLKVALNECPKPVSTSPRGSGGMDPALAPEVTGAEPQKKTVGFQDVAVMVSPLPRRTDVDVLVDLMEMGEVSSQKKTKSPDNSCVDNAQTLVLCKDEEYDTKSVDQASLSLENVLVLTCIGKRSGTCLCKECVENFKNNREDSQEPKKEDEEVEDLMLTTDNASVNSNGTKSRSGSERSRRTNSEGEEIVISRYQDAQVTLPYPDKSKAPDCITRLSNAGLYEPTKDPAREGETGNQEETEEDESQVPAFFVQHQQREQPLGNNCKKVQIEMTESLDIEKGEKETEPMLRTQHSRCTDEESVQMMPGCCQCRRGCFKIVASFVVSLLVFPAFLYATYTWLPFDAPKMPDIPTRLVYTLRCAVFASFPTVMGMIIHGISRLCVSSFHPFEPQEREVTIHQRFVKQSTFLFVLYFFNLAVLSTYLPQDNLKLIPLLTCLFALSQLIYWLSFAVGRSFRGFGYGMTFLPLLAMLGCNLFFMFLVEPEKMIFLGTPQGETKPEKNH
ncbi:transmembrane protein 79 [Pelodytes ibericus]